MHARSELLNHGAGLSYFVTTGHEVISKSYLNVWLVFPMKGKDTGLFSVTNSIAIPPIPSLTPRPPHLPSPVGKPLLFLPSPPVGNGRPIYVTARDWSHFPQLACSCWD